MGILDPPGLLRAANLSDVPAPSTARANLGLGSAATQNTSAFDAAGAATAVANAVAAEIGQPSGIASLDSSGHVPSAQLANALPTLAQASVSGSGTLALNTVTEVTAASALTMTLPTAVTGALIVVERASASTANVAVTGNIRGVASTTITLLLSNESEAFFAYGASWWPIAGHKTLGSLDARYISGGSPVLTMPAPSADATGATDTAAFTALLAKLPTVTVYAEPLNNSGSSATYPVGTIILQGTPGAFNNAVGTALVGTPYYFGTSGTTAGDIGNLGPFVSVLGPGSAQCRVAYLGSGDCFRSYCAVRPTDDSGLDMLNARGTRFDGFTLDGSQATGSHPSGLHIGDQEGTKLGDDLHIEHFTAGQLAPPVLVKGTTSGTGGTFGAGTYYWRVTALNAAGQETGTWKTGSSGGQGEISATLVANGTQAMSWAAITNAASYNVYRGTSSGSYPTLVANTASTSYTDTGAAGSAQSPPTATLAGGTGLWLDNVIGWTESFHGRTVLRNNSQNVLFTAANGAGTLGDVSFEYNDLTFKIYALQYQNGVVLAQGAWYQHGSLKIRANMANSVNVPFGCALLTLTGLAGAGHTGAGGYSQITACRLDVQAEEDTITANGGGTSSPMTIDFDSNNNNAVYGCTGVISFGFSTAWKTSNWQFTNRNTFQFLGIVSGDTVLNPAGVDFHPTYLGGMTLSTGKIFATGSPNLDANTGDMFTLTLTANLTVAFNSGNQSAGPQRKTIFITQAASGGPYTVTWPKPGSPSISSPAVYWPGGTAPTMSAAAGAIDKYVLDTMDGIHWYGSAQQALS